jgi:hypothetical protein
MTSLNKQPTLLYKATRDGFTASSFHSKCDGKAIAVYSGVGYGLTFGWSYDIYVRNYSNVYGGSTNFGRSYKLHSGYTYGQSNTEKYLAGSYNKWSTTEIEVFPTYVRNRVMKSRALNINWRSKINHFPLFNSFYLFRKKV